MEEEERAVKIIRSGDAYQRVQQVKTSLFAFVHGNDSASELKTD